MLISRKIKLFDYIVDECKQPSSSGLRNWGLYTDQLRLFIVGKLSKVEFDTFLEVDFGGRDMNLNLIPLHNAYIISILMTIRADNVDQNNEQYVSRMDNFLPLGLLEKHINQVEEELCRKKVGNASRQKRLVRV